MAIFQMETSHFYRCKNKAGVYISLAANFESEKEALLNAKNSYFLFMMVKGVERK